jgi:pimeloyl-ACP methyl ester carboxylesterase
LIWLNWESRDKSISVTAFRNQLKAVHTWGRQRPADLTVIRHPVLVANGDQDRMVPSGNSADLARRLPNARLKLYPDAGTAASSSTTRNSSAKR